VSETHLTELLEKITPLSYYQDDDWSGIIDKNGLVLDPQKERAVVAAANALPRLVEACKNAHYLNETPEQQRTFKAVQAALAEAQNVKLK
jgi:hypothetical protein